MRLPIFLRQLEDANFYLLTSLSDRSVRLAAIDVTGLADFFRAECLT